MKRRIFTLAAILSLFVSVNLADENNATLNSSANSAVNSAENSSGGVNSSVNSSFEGVNFNANSGQNSQNGVNLDDIATYELEATEITGVYQVDAHPETAIIDESEMKRTGAANVAQAIKRTPGVYFREAAGSSNSPSISIRGYSNAQIGTYIDGIPMMSIYGGGTSFDMLGTSSLSRIEVSKSFANASFGANTLGGAINLVSKKPEKELEIEISGTYIGNDGNKGKESRYGLSVGTKQRGYYFLVDYSSIKRDTYSFSKDYNSGWEAGRGYEINGWQRMQTLKMKLGWTHNENNEYSLNYILTKGGKGGLSSSPEQWQWGGGGSGGSKPVSNYNDYPINDTQTIYMLGTTYFTPNFLLDSKLFYQQFGDKEQSISRTNDLWGNSYTSGSFYDDFTYGAILNFIYELNQKSKFEFGANVKYSEHEQTTSAQNVAITPSWYYFKQEASAGEFVTSIFAQYHQGLGDFRLTLSASYDRADTTKSNIYYNYGYYTGWMKRRIAPKATVAWQGILYYDFLEGHSVHINVGQKHRMPTLRQRYSGESAEYAPNPELKPESAINYEVGYDLNLPSTAVSFAVYYNDLTDMLDSTGRFFTPDSGNCVAPYTFNNPDGTTSTGCYQIGNISQGYSYGGEIAVEQGFFKDNALVVGASYSYIAKYAKNAMENSAEAKAGNKITNYSNHIAQGKIAIKPLKDLQITGYATYESAPLIAIERRKRGTNERTFRYDKYKDNEYINFDLVAEYKLGYGFAVNFGVYNLTDRDNYRASPSYGQNSMDATDATRSYYETRVTKYHYSGRRFAAGFEWKY